MLLQKPLALALIRNQTPLPSYSNPTFIPDKIFSTLIPIFIIRHPAFAVPSNYESFIATSKIRPGDEDFQLPTKLATQRFLFDFFKQRDGKAPLVVDGDDVVFRTKEIGSAVCEALSIDPSGLRETWEPKPESERPKDPLVRHFLQVSDDSTGILRPENGERKGVEETMEGWEGKYGREVAGQLRGVVEGNMEAYEYMKGFAV